MNEVVYIAELDADVDDVIAAEYLYRKNVLKEVVCDPLPKTEQGKNRKSQLEQLGIKVSNKMPPIAKYVFVGCNIMKNPLEKFKGKQTVRTFNFNCDVNATDRVLKNKNIGTILLVGKNVCHNSKNTLDGIWKKEKELLEKYHSKPTKRQHDMLACREGLILIGLLHETSLLNYKAVYPYHTGLKGNMTEWGSTLNKSSYRSVLAAIDWK